MERWTQEEAIAFESARECITHLMAICSADMADSQISCEELEGLRLRRSKLATERAGLRVHDREAVARIRAVYGLECRARVGGQARDGAERMMLTVATDIGAVLCGPPADPHAM